MGWWMEGVEVERREREKEVEQRKYEMGR